MVERRTPEQKQQLQEIIQMRVDGFTLQEIADKYGVSEQCISHKLLSIAKRDNTRPKWFDERVIYPNIAKYMINNRISRHALAKEIGLSNLQCLTRRLYGELDFSMSEIKKLLEITGQTFEYLFSENSG